MCTARSFARIVAAGLVMGVLVGCGGESALKPADEPSGVLAPAQSASDAADAVNQTIKEREQEVNDAADEQ